MSKSDAEVNRAKRSKCITTFRAGYIAMSTGRLFVTAASIRKRGASYTAAKHCDLRVPPRSAAG